MAEVVIQEGESLENALRRFKRKVQQEDIIKEIKKHSYYMKPGEKRRAKQALSRKRLRKKQRREHDSVRFPREKWRAASGRPGRGPADAGGRSSIESGWCRVAARPATSAGSWSNGWSIKIGF